MSLSTGLYFKVVLGIIASVLLLSFLKLIVVTPLIKRAEQRRRQEAAQEYHKKLMEYFKGLNLAFPLPK